MEIQVQFPLLLYWGMVVKVPPRLRVHPEYSLQDRLPRHEYSSPRAITPRVIPA
ncbi:hypothetical protein Hanom_Chr15g01380651 [Helianthus anomalus]